MQNFARGLKVIFIFSLIIAVNVNGYSQSVKTSRIRIILDASGPERLLESGLDLSHGFYEKGKYFESDFSASEISRLESKGIPYEVLIDDVSKYYVERSTNPDFVDEFAVIESRSSGDCNQNRSKIIGDQPVNFNLGSMIGFHRYSEILSHLDRMNTMYPHLISRKASINQFITFTGKPIYHIIISNPGNQTPVPKPKILYTSLHHAREPISVTQLLYFMWYLLENYEKDALVRSIIDNYELYFIPIVNPDGYIYNEQINPAGGGNHRKNIKSYNVFDKGVDLNRNYEYNFGLNNDGSSGDHSHEEYRGPFACSESEVRAVRHLCETVPFDIALNYHSFGNALLYPWGFTKEPTEDIKSFREFGQEMLRDNSMYAGLVSDTKTIGYFTNGSSDDWMYGEQSDKNKIFSFTPEVGVVNDGFWPQINRIVPLCKEMLHTNIVSAAMLGNYGIISDAGPLFVHDTEYRFPFNIKRLGLRDGTFKVSVKPLSSNILSASPEQTIVLDQFESRIGEFRIFLDDDIRDDEEIRFVLELDNGLYIQRDTISKTFLSNELEIFSDGAWNLNGWIQASNDNWKLNDEDAYSPPFSFTNTIAEPYRSNETSIMTLREPLDLRSARAAYITFKTKYVIEPEYDKAQITASTTGFQFQPLCGKLSKSSINDRTLGVPVYEGFQYDWVFETIDLKDYLGSRVYLSVEFHSDEEDHFEGFSFDDFRVVVVNDPLLNADEDLKSSLQFQLFPNPTSGELYYRLLGDYGINSEFHIRMYNVVGQLVHTEKLYGATEQAGLKIPKLVAGMYTYQLLSNSSVLRSSKFIMR